MGLTAKLMYFFRPLLKKCLKASEAAGFTILTGFLCGFPLGAKTAVQFFQRGELSRNDSLWLLSFCNNIGPAYFCSFVIPLLNVQNPLAALFAVYGIPFCYGCFLRLTLFKPSGLSCKESSVIMKTEKFGTALETSIAQSAQSLMMLGGYMIIFCTCNLIPHLIYGKRIPQISLVLEITSGLSSMNGKHPMVCLSLLTFGGLCCLAQTYSTLKGSELETYLPKYLFHKLIQSGLVFLFCVIWNTCSGAPIFL